MNKNIGIIAAFLVLVLLAAIGVRALLRDEPAALSAPVTAGTANPGVAAAAASPATTATLQQEIAAREQLALTVARLETELKELKAQMHAQRAAPVPAPVSETAPSRTAAPVQTTAADSDTPDEQRLRDAGLSATQVAQVRERYEQLEMDRLYLRDRATREGWMGTVRYSNEVAKLEAGRQEIRNNLGDDGYDAYLFASGESNRVLIREMLQGSPAKQAGIQAGDTVIRYDDKRVFTTRELQNATTGGRQGEMVRVEIERDGKRLDLYVPRGPLGVYLDNDSVKP